MQFLNWLAILLFVPLPVLTKEPKQLVVENVYKPKKCEVFAKPGDTIRVHYTGILLSNGDKFDSSRDRGSPLSLMLGAGQVIKGWDEGLKGMCVEEKRKLTIPPDMAYGSHGFGSLIPPDSALVFDVELVGLDPIPSHEEL